MDEQEERFEFGENWRSFLAALDEERIAQAVESLRVMLQVDTLRGRRFLDLGSGSGLFSLAAHRLGAEVLSVDFDDDSVACTEEVRRRFGQGDTDGSTWQVRQGSVLDEPMMSALGRYDLVYSWGVLHHTGQMWKAIDLASERTEVGGEFFLSIYNDQGAASRRWLMIKQTHHRLPRPLKPIWVTLVAGVYETKFALARAVRLRNPLPFRDWRAKKEDRGMSAWHDWVDWVGGLPFEVATPDQIVSRLRQRGFRLQKQKLIGKGWGCNEFVFRRESESTETSGERPS